MSQETAQEVIMPHAHSDPSDVCDFLFLNASNYPRQAVFPHAFIQVSALARQHGLKTARFDFLGRPQAEWPGIVAELVARHRPRMVGLHLRQADSQHLNQIKQVEGAPPPTEAYFPVDDSKLLIRWVREVTDVPIVMGGFGFTVHPGRICEFLQPDYGVLGGPDDFFSHFEALARRDLSAAEEVANLLYRDDDGRYQSGPQVFFGPLDAPEYTDELFTELCSFYARHGRRLSLGELGEVDPPVEVMRGCPCRCYFCTEPTVKGRRPQTRDLDVIMQEVAFLAERDVRCVWFICSEINMTGMKFPLALAARMQAFNDARDGRPVLWRTYNMPRPGMSREDLTVMMRAGFIPAWNEFLSLSDANLKRAGMPYRAKDAVRYLNDVLELSRDRSIYRGPKMYKFEMFLGNAHIDAASLRETLDVVDREGYADMHSYGHAIMATRVYELEGKLNCGSTDQAFTIGPEGPKDEVDLLHPSFHYAPGLLQILGGMEAVERFLQYIAHTFLSHSYRELLNLPAFVAAAISAEDLAGHLESRAVPGLRHCRELYAAREKERDEERGDQLDVSRSRSEALWRAPSAAAVREQLTPDARPEEAALRARVVEDLLEVLFALNARDFAPVYAFLSLQDEAERATRYRIVRRLLARFDSNEDLLAQARAHCSLSPGSLSDLQLQVFLYTHNVRLDPTHRPLLVRPKKLNPAA